MAHTDTEEEDDDRCRVITEVAMEKAMNKCGSEEAVRNQLKRIIGMENGDENIGVEQTLADGLTVATLANTKKTREWVFSRSRKLVQEEDMTIPSAVSKAWSEARSEGEEEGFEV